VIGETPEWMLGALVGLLITQYFSEMIARFEALAREGEASD
jgi:hypothetical protein